MLYDTQSASSRIRTRVTVSISYDNSHYTTSNSLSLSLSHTHTHTHKHTYIYNRVDDSSKSPDFLSSFVPIILLSGLVFLVTSFIHTERIKVFLGRLTKLCLCAGVRKRTLLISSSLFLQQCHTCFVHVLLKDAEWLLVSRLMSSSNQNCRMIV